MVLSVFCPGLNDRQNPGVAKDVPPASGVPAKHIPGWLAILFLIAVALMASPAALADELQDYAQQCDQAVGASATVRDFDCDAGTEVLHNEPNSSGTCDEPNRLNKVCDFGSHFQVLTRSDDAYVVAHCRKEGNASGEYRDIAVIQYNRKNGATCFYQALGTIPGHVPPPSKGQSGSLWLTPSSTASIGCGGCHDNGPFIRSPYLNQIPKPKRGERDDTIPGKDDIGFNKDQLYAFVGQDFASWKAFKVEVGNECTSCHRLGVSNVPAPGFGDNHICGIAGNCGTAHDFAERATSATEISEVDSRPSHKTFPPSGDSPMWMPPECPVDSGQHCVSPLQVHVDAAKAIHDCAMRFHENPLPNTDACRITLFAAAYVPPPPLCPTGVRALTDLNESTTTFDWSTPSGVDHLNIRRNGDVGPSGLLIFPDGKSVLAPTTTTVTVPFDQDYLATYNVCTVGGDAQTCCAEPITPRRRLCVEVGKCRIHGRDVLATDTDDPKTWCSDIGGKIVHFWECTTSGGGTTDSPLH